MKFTTWMDETGYFVGATQPLARAHIVVKNPNCHVAVVEDMYENNWY